MFRSTKKTAPHRPAPRKLNLERCEDRRLMAADIGEAPQLVAEPSEAQLLLPAVQKIVANHSSSSANVTALDAQSVDAALTIITAPGPGGGPHAKPDGILFGGAGNDIVLGEAGSDLLVRENRFLEGGAGHDMSGPAQDILFRSQHSGASNILLSGDGNDIVEIDRLDFRIDPNGER